MKSRFLKTLLSAMLVTASSYTAMASNVTISAAVSLKDALTEIAAGYEKLSGDKLVFNFGGSNVLARQIEEGAPVDLFFSADESQMDAVAQKGLLAQGTRRDVLSNALVIVLPADSSLAVKNAQDLADDTVKKIALADPKAVPAGVYAKEYLEKLGLWKTIEPKVVSTENVRAALAAVESDNVEAGIVYQTDAGISKKVKVVFVVPAGDGPAIHYPAALLKGAAQPDAAKKFLDYLGGPEAARVFEKYGFVVPK
jgi:molybdate transport system substrate-binding protein